MQHACDELKDKALELLIGQGLEAFSVDILRRALETIADYSTVIAVVFLGMAMGWVHIE
jgi:hypothetical protein